MTGILTDRRMEWIMIILKSHMHGVSMTGHVINLNFNKSHFIFVVVYFS